MSYSYAVERPRLFTEPGMALVQGLTRNVVELCSRAGAVRASEAWKGVPHNDSWLAIAALDYLVETCVLSEVTPSDVLTQRRVFVLNPSGPYGGAS